MAPVLGCVRCSGLCVWTQSLMRPVPRTVHPLTRDPVGAPGLFCVDGDTSPLRVGRHHARVPCLCSYACSSRPGRAGLPPGRLMMRLMFPVAALSFCPARRPAGFGCPCSAYCLPFFFHPLSAPHCLLLSLVPGRGVLGLGAVFSFGFFPLFSFFGSLSPRCFSLLSGFWAQVSWALALCCPFPPGPPLVFCFLS